MGPRPIALFLSAAYRTIRGTAKRREMGQKAKSDFKGFRLNIAIAAALLMLIFEFVSVKLLNGLLISPKPNVCTCVNCSDTRVIRYFLSLN